MAESGLPADAAAAPAAVSSPRCSPQGSRLHIVVPDRLLVDDPAGTVIRGCVPGQVVTVTASCWVDGFVHEATAAFTPCEDGSVDTARDASAAGSYTGTDPFGLWWAGTPATPAAHPPSPPEPIACRLTAETARMAVTAGFQRHWLTAGATVTEVDQPGVTGMFARPAGPGPFPGVVAFGGSGGGLGPAAAWAPMLASHGIATLAIAYFGAPGLPTTLTGIEVEVVERAARWLLSRADITPGTVAAMGMSRGSELALWAGALLDVIGAVVGFAPSGISWPGFNADGPTAAPAWTFRGRPLPYATVGAAAQAAQAPSSGPPVALRAVFEPTLANAGLFEHAVIPVEEIRGPVLFVSGEADTMWPATKMTQITEQRARDRGFRYPLVHLRYRDGGHVCAGVPVSPAIVMGPPCGVFCHEHGTTWLPVMGPPPGVPAWGS